MATTVPASEYRANLRRWHERVARGEEIVVTDNGEPVAVSYTHLTLPTIYSV